jgi:hypothetical protein
MLNQGMLPSEHVRENAPVGKVFRSSAVIATYVQTLVHVAAEVCGVMH